MVCDSVIFDLDGTLWDSTETVAESWNLSLREQGHPLPVFTAADIAGIMGMTEQQISNKLFHPVFGEAADKICAQVLIDEAIYTSIHGGAIYKGVEALLQKLSQSRTLCIVSNCQAGYIEGFLSYSGFGKYIKDIECIGNSGLSKAENISLVIERNGLKNPVYVGDTGSDEKSAAAAGCPFIHAAYGFGTASSPIAVISEPLQLLEILE